VLRHPQDLAHLLGRISSSSAISSGRGSRPRRWTSCRSMCTTLFRLLDHVHGERIVRALSAIRKGYKVSTYGGTLIRRHPAIADKARTIRIPVHMVEKLNKVVHIDRSSSSASARSRGRGDREELEMKTEECARSCGWRSTRSALEKPIGEGEDSELGDFVEDENTETPDEAASAHAAGGRTSRTRSPRSPSASGG